jgi:hypothetical protein
MVPGSNLSCETIRIVCPCSYLEHASVLRRSISTLCQVGILSEARGRLRGRTEQNNG